MTVEDCIIIGGSQLRWYLPSVAPRTSTVWYGVIFLSETRRQLVHRHNLPPAQISVGEKAKKDESWPSKNSLRKWAHVCVVGDFINDKTRLPRNIPIRKI